MQSHINQAVHNRNFHHCIDTKFAGQYSDWKITVLYYVAIHYLKALAAKRGITLGDTHYDIEHNINPAKDNCRMRITKNAWHHYRSLLKYSRTSRYEGIMDIAAFESLKENDHSHCLQHLTAFKNYIIGQEIPLP